MTWRSNCWKRRRCGSICSSKSERGYRLVQKDDEPPSAAAAEPVVLDAEMTLEDALQRVGRICLAHMLRSEPAALAGKIEGVHQMRVATRRLRSMLSALKKMLPEAERRWVSDEIKVLTGGARPGAQSRCVRDRIAAAGAR